jgi:hypothetical protein
MAWRSTNEQVLRVHGSNFSWHVTSLLGAASHLLGEEHNTMRPSKYPWKSVSVVNLLKSDLPFHFCQRWSFYGIKSLEPPVLEAVSKFCKCFIESMNVFSLQKISIAAYAIPSQILQMHRWSKKKHLVCTKLFFAIVALFQQPLMRWVKNEKKIGTFRKHQCSTDTTWHQIIVICTTGKSGAAVQPNFAVSCA